MNFIDLIFPKRCILCLSRADNLCDQCLSMLKPSLPECPYCRRFSSEYTTHIGCRSLLTNPYYKEQNSSIMNENVLPLTSATYLWRYDELASSIMVEAKYHSSFEIFRSLGRAISYRMSEIKLSKDYHMEPVLVPIPSHRFRVQERGFDHTSLITKQFHAALDQLGFKSQINDNLLIRKRNTPHQASISRAERYRNMNESFTADLSELEKVGGRPIVLVDDVMTTGSTLFEAGRSILTERPDIDLSGLILFRGDPSFASHQLARNTPTAYRLFTS